MAEKIRLRKNLTARGKAGIVNTSGVFTHDYLDKLHGIEGSFIFDKMRKQDASVKGLLGAVVNPIKAAKWQVDPGAEKGKKPDAKNIKAQALIEQILFKDFPHGWKQKLGEILTLVPFGHSVFEVVHQNKTNKKIGPYTGLRNLAFRSQTTLTEWIHDRNTHMITEIRQEQREGDFQIDVKMPADTLLMFFNEREGDDNGVSMLRSVYGPYQRKLLYLQLLAVGMERNAIGVLVVTVPRDMYDDDEQMAKLEDMIGAFTSNEAQDVTVPAGVEIQFQQSAFDGDKIKSAIKMENEEMAKAFLATFLELGMGDSGGAYALSQDLSDFFFVCIQHFADQIADTINLELIPHLLELNFGPDAFEIMPKLKHSGIQRRAGVALAEVISKFISSKAIAADRPLEDFLRELYDLPEKDEETAAPIVEPPAPPPPAPSGGDLPPAPPEPEPDAPPPAVLSMAQAVSAHITVAGNTPAETIMLADKVQRTIDKNEANVRSVMVENVTFMGNKMIADVLKRYEALPNRSKLKATNDIKVGGKAKYKSTLKGALTVAATEALDQVRREVPGGQDIKFADDPKASIKAAQLGIKLNEFSRLPKHVQILISQQADALVEKQAADLSQIVVFNFQTAEGRTNDVAIISTELNDGLDKYLTSQSIVAGAANTTAAVVNDTRKEFFYEPEVLEQIQSFTFINPSPVSQICKEIAGQTFKATDQAALRFQPPLHHNCKTYIRANLKTTKNAPEPNPQGINISRAGLRSQTLTAADGAIALQNSGDELPGFIDFNTSIYSRDQAIKWARDHGFRFDAVHTDQAGSYWTMKQADDPEVKYDKGGRMRSRALGIDFLFPEVEHAVN